ncbi:MAG: nucleoside kinase [Erysipelotrichaceae bacterium]|nr:nucleoside kinase [Erysipelotrichaceae bacterium]
MKIVLEGNEYITTCTTYYELAESLNMAPYPALGVTVNNNYYELDRCIEENDVVEWLTFKSQGGNFMYQHGLILLLKKALKDVTSINCNIEIANSLNKGIYIQVKQQLSKEEVGRVENRMKELVELDLPITKVVLTKEEMISFCKEEGLKETEHLVKSNAKKTYILHELEGVRCWLNGWSVITTSAFKLFELLKYKYGLLLRFPLFTDLNKVLPYEDQQVLYKAFAEATKWHQLMRINYVADLNRMVESGKIGEIIQISEALHEKKISDIADMIKSSGKRMVLIAGPSSSGKTTFAKRLCIQLKITGLDPLYLGTDDYFKEREETPLDENGEKDFEGLGAVDIDLFNQQMKDLLEGKEVDLPTFDFITGSKRFGERITKLDKHQIIVIEGIHGLNNELTPLFTDDQKFKIYISPLTPLNIDRNNRISTTDARMLRRMVRDMRLRGKSVESTIMEWPKVRKGEEKNIFPYSKDADIFFNSVHIYEMAILKYYVQPLLKEIDTSSEVYGEAQRLVKFLDLFSGIEADNKILANSIIREFIGGSIFM